MFPILPGWRGLSVRMAILVMLGGFCAITTLGCSLITDHVPWFFMGDGSLQIGVENLSHELRFVRWRQRFDWTAKSEWEARESHRPALDSLRWRLGMKPWQDTWKDMTAGWDPAPSQGPLLWALAQEDTLPGWHAAILYARLFPQEAQELEPTLHRLVVEPPTYVLENEKQDSVTEQTNSDVKTSQPAKPQTQKIPTAMRAAAAEAWCLVLIGTHPDPIDALAPAGRVLTDQLIPADLRGALFRGIGRWVPPANIPGLNDALSEKYRNRRNPLALRQAAMDACLLFAYRNRETVQKSQNAEELWPTVLRDWQWEPDAYFESDATIRERFSEWMAVTKNPNAAKLLSSQLNDRNPDVRDAALKALGELATPEALQTLKDHATRPEPRVRAVVVKGLAHFGPQYLSAFLEDESSQVRTSVAEELSRFPTPNAARWLQSLQADDSPQVEQAALQATGDWPDALAIPVLLHGMEHASLKTRRDCFRELRRRTGLQETFPISAGPQVRRAAIKQLTSEWQLPVQVASAEPARKKLNRLRVNELHALLSDAINPEFPEDSQRFRLAIERLQESTDEDIPAIEAFLAESRVSVRLEKIVTEVLVPLSPIHNALQNFQHREVQLRRTAANQLRQETRTQSLSPFALRRLEDRMEYETDPQVWRMVMLAILPDGNPTTARIASWAAEHLESSVRLLACEFASRHRRPEFATWLQPLFDDSTKTVQVAAIDAAGLCQNRSVIVSRASGKVGFRSREIPGLQQLLTHQDSEVSTAAAIAMSRLGDPAGHDELIRLSHHHSEEIRQRVLEAMGETGQTRFVAPLIDVARTTTDPRLQGAALESLTQLVPENNHPRELRDHKSARDQIQIWVKWQERQASLRVF